MNSKKINPIYISKFSGKTIAEGDSDFHHYKFITHEKYGLCLFLDEILQSSSYDQEVYHKMMTLFALKYVGSPENVLIVGGAGGGILHQLFKFRNEVKKVEIVDVDKKLFEIAPLYMKEWCGDSLKDSRVKIFYENGVDFLSKSNKKYDLIFLDIGDPLEITKSNEMYNEFVYDNICKSLNPNGAMIFHSAPFAIKGNIFYKCYENDLTKTEYEYHSKQIFLESFETKWIFNLIKKPGIKISSQ